MKTPAKVRRQAPPGGCELGRRSGFSRYSCLWIRLIRLENANREVDVGRGVAASGSDVIHLKLVGNLVARVAVSGRRVVGCSASMSVPRPALVGTKGRL